MPPFVPPLGRMLLAGGRVAGWLTFPFGSHVIKDAIIHKCDAATEK
jgi:hypothetical protein